MYQLLLLLVVQRLSREVTTGELKTSRQTATIH